MRKWDFPIVLHPHVSDDGHYDSAKCIDDQVFHRVRYAAFLHVEVEKGVHYEFVDFPNNSHRYRKSHRKKRNKSSRKPESCSFLNVEYEYEKETDDS